MLLSLPHSFINGLPVDSQARIFMLPRMGYPSRRFAGVAAGTGSNKLPYRQTGHFIQPERQHRPMRPPEQDFACTRSESAQGRRGFSN
jgi:hypothetical protein